ncbi:hypothetical protein AC1031_011417 [Aphanomyces cochlioides]|nr:hypothetical protein AC1031_011417 [Aphanomyces cochlioides]
MSTNDTKPQAEEVTGFSYLPFDVVVKIAFFLPEWRTVLDLLQALHPAKALGPLDHQWQLNLLGWKSDQLWPSLDITKMDKISQIHLSAITIYYSEIMVDCNTDLAAFHRFIHPTASIICKIPNTHSLNQLKDFPITKFHLDRLERGQDITEAIFKFAASSISLRELEASTFERAEYFHCTINTSMVANLLKWIEFNPVRRLKLENFSWETPSLLHQVVSAAMSCPTLDRTAIFGTYVSNMVSRGWPIEFYDWIDRKLGQDNIISPLEHLWHLHFLGWNNHQLWPRLDLTEMDEASKVHVSAIAMYYDEILVRFDVDLPWLRQNIHPKAFIYYKAANEEVLLQSLSHFKENCIPQIDFELHDLHSRHGDHIFQTFEGENSNHCIIDASLATELVKWIERNPVQNLTLVNFSWETPTEFVASGRVDCIAVSSTASFGNIGRLPIPFDSVKFHGFLQFIQNAGDITVLVDAFGMAIHAKAANLHLHGLPPSTFSNVWEMLFPLIHSSQIRAINFENSSIGDNGAIRMAQDFRQLEQLEYLCVDETGVDFEGLKALMMAAPPSVHTIAIVESRYDFVRWFTLDQMSEVVKLAKELSIECTARKQYRILALRFQTRY